MTAPDLGGLRLGINLGYVGMGQGEDAIELGVAADRAGYDIAWVAEAYGSDAVSVLAWLGARTERIGLGSAVLQIPGRTPALTAMTAATLDRLSGSRFRLGLGVSGPQVSEGWHGVRFTAPLARTREYVTIVRSALRRERVTHTGEHFTLPLPDGPGKPLKLTIVPPRADLPIYLAAVGPNNLRLAGEIADGWLGIFFSPEHSAETIAALRAGREQAGRGTAADPLAGFDVCTSVPVVLSEDRDLVRALIAPHCALYIGGMGSREQNFYNALATRMGFGSEAAQIQDLYLAGRHRDAAAAVPWDFLDAVSLVGSPERVAGRIGRYAASGVTTLAITPWATDTAGRIATTEMMATLFECPSN